VEGRVIKEGRQWRLQNGEQWLDGVKFLYNRACYEVLIKDMKSKKLVLIKGTPGIGKTTFLERLLVHIVEESKIEGNPIPTIVLAMMREKGTVKEFLLNADGTV